MSIFVILKIWCSILIAINDTAMQCTPDCIIADYIFSIYRKMSIMVVIGVAEGVLMGQVPMLFEIHH